MKKTLLSLLLSVSSCAAFAQWTQLPTEGGEIRDLITTPGGILLATEGGVFKSTDGANTWAYSSNGLFVADSAISCNQFASTSTAHFVQTNNGIAKTTDDGSTWVSAGNTGITGSNGGSFSGLVAVSNKLYTCKYVNMNTYQIFTSTNDGANWTPGANVYSNNNSPKLFSVGGMVYVTKQDSVFTTATGASLTAMSYTGFPVSGDQIGRLSGDGTYLYAGFSDGGAGFFRYDIGNSTWQTMTSGMAPFIFSAGPYLVNNILYASILTTSMTLQTYTSTTQGTTWNQTSLSGLTKDFVEQIYSLGGSNMLVYNPVDELATSSDNGSTWTQHITGFKADVYRDSRSISYSNGNLVASQDLGIVRSVNGGASWLPANTGMPTTLFFNYSLYNANNTLYSSFMDISGSYLYKSTDGAVTWTAATMPAGVNEIEFAGHSNTAVFVIDRNNNNYHRSIDGGASWTNITSNLNGTYNYNNKIVTDGTTIYLIGNSGSGWQVFKSTDDGNNWTTISMAGMPPGPNLYIGDNIFMSGNTLMCMWADYSGMPYTYKMCTYTGTNWTYVTVNGLPPGLISSCTGNCGNRYDQWFTTPAYIYYMTNRGLFYSSDNGATFVPFNTGFYPGINVNRLATDGATLYAGTEGNSIWSVTAPLGLNTYTKAESLVDIYPNPAINSATVTYSKDVVDASSKLIITDMLGATVQEINLPAGSNQIDLSTSNLKSGVYFYTITSATKKSVAKKLVISK